VRVLQTFDPVRHAHAELADRRSTGLPPVARTVRLTGPRTEVVDALARLQSEIGTDVLRPLVVEDEDDERTQLLAFARAASADVSRALTALAAHRSAAGLPIVRHVVDPAGAL
jgi:primosomal protein N' (replication factor Y)